MTGWPQWLFLALLLAAAIAGFAVHVGSCQLTPDTTGYTVRGIDVSHHQGPIDWNRLHTAGLAFAFIKATEGCDHRDRRFGENWQAAARIGVTRGAYHFFSFCKDPDCQADNFIEVVPRHEPTLPPAVDIEFTGNCRNPPDVATIRRNLDTMIGRLRQAYDAPPVLYVTSTSYGRIAADLCADCPLWIRDTWAEPHLPSGMTWAFWQHDDRGRLPGINTDVDLNVFRADQAALDTLVRPPESG